MSIELYRQYSAALKDTPIDGQFVGYDWGELPKTLNMIWMAYREMFNEFSREIANSLNQLTNYTHRLRAWSGVIASIEDQHKLEDAVDEFIDPLATVSLNMPYIIRSRFLFATAHLCHQANQVHGGGMPWKDDIPLNCEIYFAEADKYGAKWRKYAPLKLCLEKIGNKKYQSETHDFRNAYNHRFSPRIVVGLTGLVTRNVDAQTKKVSYSLGYLSPLALDVVVNLLIEQCKYGLAAFDAFQMLIKEHEAGISEHQRRS